MRLGGAKSMPYNRRDAPSASHARDVDIPPLGAPRATRHAVAARLPGSSPVI